MVLCTSLEGIIAVMAYDGMAHQLLEAGEHGYEPDEGGVIPENYPLQSQALDALPELATALEDGVVN